MERPSKEVRLKVANPIHDSLAQQAEDMGLPFSQYVRHLMIEAVRKHRRKEPEIQASGFDFEPFDL